MQEMYDGLSDDGRVAFAAMGPWGTLGMMGCLSWYFLLALGGTGQPHMISKFMMNRRMSDVKYIYPVALVGFLLSALLWLCVGLAMRTLVRSIANQMAG